ncbi:hypothetical protein CsatA_026483 [Cannabis sativa]
MVVLQQSSLFGFLLLLLVCFVLVRSDDGETLMRLKSTIDPLDSLPWRGSTEQVCQWKGVKECMNGRVSKLVLEYLNLTGVLDQKILDRLDQLRVLSFKGNSINGQIPDLSGLANLKSLFLNQNNFSGDFPASISGLHRLKVVVLADNQISGKIPATLLNLRRLYFLDLRNNLLTGEIPPFNQTSLRFFNVSNNKLSGAIPVTSSLVRFNSSSFAGNVDLCGDQQMNYSLEDLLKASAETLGRGSIGSTYKAVMESGFIVTVKRLKDAKYPRLDEFRRQMEVIGRLRHPNLVPLRAYFQAREERLLVYDYFPNGSLFSLIHGSRTSGGGKPLHWTSCLKIAEDLGSGLLYIHQSSGLTHGNLKSSNVLLGSDFESCLTDYGLTSFRDPDSLEEPSATSLFYRAPECRDIRRPSTQPADVYSFGVLLLELLTGKTPFQDLVQEHGSDIPRWVRSVREEETESGDDPASGNETSEEKLLALLNISMACVSLVPENRPTMREVLKMIRDARAEAQLSSNSSDHSPGRWSDTVQSLPREEHLSI